MKKNIFFNLIKMTISKKNKLITDSQLSTKILISFLFFIVVFPVDANAQNPEAAPFGFHQGNANNYEYLFDLGASWSREGLYIVWNWVDVNRNGHFSFKNAIAPPKPGEPNSGGPVNYDEELLYIPDEVMIMKNILPFRKRGEFADEAEKNHYYNFVKATVERYDGDSDLGCTESYPDCYSIGDNEYPDQKLIERLQRNPVKYWQVCNQLFDVCEIDCKNTYAAKFAEVLKLTYISAKEANPSVQILIAGDSQMMEYPAVFNELNGEYIDIIDLHRFGVESQYNAKDDLDYIKAALVNAGFNLSDLKFWITETNTYSGDPVPRVADEIIDLPYQNEKQHASGLIKIYVSDLAQGVEKVFWAWNIVEGYHRNGSIFDYSGLIYDGFEWTGISTDDPNGIYSNDPEDILYDKGAGVKKLAYYTYKVMTQKLAGSNWENTTIVTEGTDNIYVYKFHNNENPIWIIWWDWFNDPSYSDGDLIEYELIVDNADSVIVTGAVPNVESGNEILPPYYLSYFPLYKENVENGSVIINLKKEPIYVEVVSNTTTVEKLPEGDIPSRIYLSANYPNPFNPTTMIKYNIPNLGNVHSHFPQHVLLKVYDMLGREVATLVDDSQSPGSYEVEFTPKSGLASGAYIYRLSVTSRAGSYSEVRKMLLLK